MHTAEYNQPEPFNWIVHNTILEKVVAFLQSHSFVPDRLNIQADGWAEAYFTYPVKADIKPAWYLLERQGKVEISQPMYEMTSGDYNLLHIKFRLKQPLTRWQRLKHFVS